jgi:signal transduction histidine kinase
LDDSEPLAFHEDVGTRPIATRLPILVIDDVPANLVAMEIALAPLDREVVGVTSGMAALGQLLERDFSLVLLDVQMPGMNGFETATMIRARERSRHLPIIFVTAYRDDREAERRAYQLGAVDFLFKPIETEIVVAKATVFVTLHDQAVQLATARLQHNFDEARRRYETRALRREMAIEQFARTELARLNEALAEADRKKDAFLAILAHELRNPLAPICAAIDLARQQPELLGQPTIDILDRQTALLSRLVDDLLDIARITANKLELRREVHDLRTIVERSVATSEPWIAQRRHRLSVELPDRPMPVHADHLRLVQVVVNLINNAARYTEPEGSITITGSVDGDWARVRVIDTGIGIPPAILDKIFDMFVQERVPADRSGGLGLGLALAKQLVEMHGGTIRAESRGRGMGSCFEISFPIATATRPVEPGPVVLAAAT